MRFWIGILILSLFTLSCVNQSEYEGYSLTESGLNYKIHTIGDPTIIPKDSDVISLNYIVETLDDSLVLTHSKTILYLKKNKVEWNEFIGLLAQNDSATAIMSSNSISQLLSVSISKQILKLSVIPVRIEPYRHWAFNVKYPELATDLELDEQVALLNFLNQFHSDSVQYIRGVFIGNQIIGTGNKPVVGDEVLIHYSVKNMEGKLLDSTRERNEMFSYVIGQQDQVLEGFDIGIREMKKGGKAILIVPSVRAFGKNGSSTGIVKGYQTLIYSVEIIDLLGKESEELERTNSH